MSLGSGSVGSKPWVHTVPMLGPYRGHCRVLSEGEGVADLLLRIPVGLSAPLTFGLMALVVLAVALVACTVPATGAAGMDPVGAVRGE